MARASAYRTRDVSVSVSRKVIMFWECGAQLGEF